MDSTAKHRIVDHAGRAVNDATLARIFQPMSPELFDDPVCGAALRRLAAEEPDIIAGVADADRTLIRDLLDATPGERLLNAVHNWIGIQRLRDAG